jgi:hypothetical protein
LNRTDTENERIKDAYSVRRDPKIKEMLLDLEERITAAVGNVSMGLGEFEPQQMVEALSDRELLTLHLWIEETDTVISDEVKRRRGEYGEFTRRFGDPGKS